MGRAGQGVSREQLISLQPPITLPSNGEKVLGDLEGGWDLQGQAGGMTFTIVILCRDLV